MNCAVKNARAAASPVGVARAATQGLRQAAAVMPSAAGPTAAPSGWRSSAAQDLTKAASAAALLSLLQPGRSSKRAGASVNFGGGCGAGVQLASNRARKKQRRFRARALTDPSRTIRRDEDPIGIA